MGPALALGLAALAVGAKPPALFGMLVVVAFCLWSRPDRAQKRRMRAVAFAAGAAGAVLCVVVLAWWPELPTALVRQVRADLVIYGLRGRAGGPAQVIRDWLQGWVHAALFYPAATYLSGPILLAVGLARRLPDPKGRDHPELRVGVYCAFWLLGWWLLVPLTVFRDARVAFVTVPVCVLGVLGLKRLLDSSQGLPSPRRLIPALAALWLAGMWASSAADATGMRARWWLPLTAVLVSLGAMLVVRVAGAGRRGAIALVLAVVLGQAAAFAFELTRRTRLIARAQQVVAGQELRGAAVCGSHAPALLLARPTNARPLYTLYAPDCKLDGHLSEWVLLPRGAWCQQAYPQAFMVRNAEWLSRLPEAARVAVPQWQGRELRLCDLSLLRLPSAESRQQK